MKMIATFSITKVNLCFLSQTMISIAHFEITRNGEKTKILAKRAASVQSVVDRSKYMEPASARSGKENIRTKFI